MRRLLRFLVRGLYGFRVYNAAVLETPGPVLLLPNHTSWWDWLLIGVCVDEDWKFVTSIEGAEKSWIHKRIMINRRTFPVDMNSPYSVKHMAEFLQRGGRLVLFPEGRLSRTGSLMKLFDGTGFLISKTRAKVITAYLRGARRLPLSPNPGLKELFPRLSVHFSSLLNPPRFEHMRISEARTRVTDWVYDSMIRQQFETEMASGAATVPEAILAAARRRKGMVITQDATMQQLTYRRLITATTLLARQWNRWPAEEHQRVGVLLPNVNAMPVALLSLWLCGKVPAVLNYSTGPATLLECTRLAGLNRILSSRAFVERLSLDLEPFKAAGIQFVFLEDARAGISKWQKLMATITGMPRTKPRNGGAQAEDTCLILFTSGSEGIPKGVALSHRNLLANIRQMLSVIDLVETDRFFNALPLFHCFGLTIGLLLPLIQGVFVCLYLSPLHYRVVPSALYNLDCTVFFGTNTFLAGYARKAHPYDFRSLRYLFAGAERLQETTIAFWQSQFGVRVLEGYGATECSPALCANTPMRHRAGSVGQFLPGIEHRLEPVAGIEGGNTSLQRPEHADGSGVKRGAVGRLFVRGPNVMQGYLNRDADAAFQAQQGWYDTGDLVQVDPDGYVYVAGRLKRFAKISGEMISLTAVEDALADAFPQYGLKFAVAVVARSDETKGEKLIAVTNEPKLTLEQVREAVRARGLSNLATPRQLKCLPDLPRLGSGKVNHRELEMLV